MFPLHFVIAGLCSLACLSASMGSAVADGVDDNADERVVKDPRMILNPTAWMPKPGQIHADIGLTHLYRVRATASIGLADIAEFGIERREQRSQCNPCDAGEQNGVEDVSVNSAFLKIGLPEGTGHEFAPAVALNFRKSFAGAAQFSRTDTPISARNATLNFVVSKSIGPVGVHVGADMLVAEGSAEQGDFGVDDFVVRPAAGIQWRPEDFPKSTFLVDLRWVPHVEDMPMSDTITGDWSTRWNAAVGLRYRTRYGFAVDVNVRGQEAAGLEGLLFTAGVRGELSLQGSDSH